MPAWGKQALELTCFFDAHMDLSARGLYDCAFDLHSEGT